MRSVRTSSQLRRRRSGSTARANSDADDTTATVAAQKAAGADFVKIGMVNDAAFFAALAAGQREVIPVAGHVPAGVSTLDASRAGIRSIEHLGPQQGVLITCTRDAEAFLAAASTPPALLLNPPPIPFGEALMMRLLNRIVINPGAMLTHQDVQAIGEIVAAYDEATCRASARVYAANHTWQVPTLIRRKTSDLAFLDEFLNDPDIARFTACDLMETWIDITTDYAEGLDAEDRAILQRAYTLSKDAARIMDAEGVRMLTGSDSTGAGWMVPGFALHREFRELADAGLTPLRVLQMTTLDAAEFSRPQRDDGHRRAGQARRPRHPERQSAGRRRKPAEHRLRGARWPLLVPDGSGCAAAEPPGGYRPRRLKARFHRLQ